MLICGFLGMYILGSAIGGFFLAWFGMTLNYIIDSVTYLISLFFVWRLTNIPKIIPTPAEIEMEDDENEIANALADEDNNEQLVSSDTNGGIDIEVYSITKRPPWLQAVVDHFRSLKDGFLYLGRNKYLLALTMLKGTSSLVWGAVEFVSTNITIFGKWILDVPTMLTFYIFRRIFCSRKMREAILGH
jgi:hypothetical protein